MHTLHKAVFILLRPLVRLFFWFKFGYTCEKAKDLPDHFIVLANHTTDFDPLFVALKFFLLYQAYAKTAQESALTK